MEKLLLLPAVLFLFYKPRFRIYPTPPNTTPTQTPLPTLQKTIFPKIMNQGRAYARPKKSSLYITMDGGIGERPERPPGTRGAKNDSRNKCQSGRKMVFPRVPKRCRKGRKNKTRAHRRCGGKTGGEKGHKRAAPHPKTKALV